MSSGKQTSFSFGEISPEFHYQADSNMFTNGLKKLFNGITRTTGGVCNRPGTKLFYTNVEVGQDEIVKGKANSRIFSWFSKRTNKRYTLLMFPKLPTGNSGILVPHAGALPIEIYDEDGVKQTIVNLPFNWPAGPPGPTAQPMIDLDSVDFRFINNDLIMTFRIINFNGDQAYYEIERALFVVKFPEATTAFFEVTKMITRVEPPFVTELGALNIISTGTPLNIPVSYEVWVEYFDGTEHLWQFKKNPQGTPQSTLFNVVDGYSTPEGADIKQYNVYRAIISYKNPPGEYTGAGTHGLVARLPPDNTREVNADYLLTPDLTYVAPHDNTLETLAANPGKINRVFYAKERYLVIPKEGLLDDNSVVASKLGSKFFLKRGLFPREIDSFSFVVNSADNIEEELRYFADLKNTLVFTSKSVYSLKGSEGGVIAFSNISPDRIHGEGVAENVSPTTVGGLAFFLNRDKSGIVALRPSGNVNDLYESELSSQFSSHFFNKRDVRRVIGVKGADTIIYCLRSDGTIISMTYDQNNNVKGFGQHKINGFVEDICVTEVSNYLRKRKAPEPMSDPSTYRDPTEIKVPSIAMTVISDKGVRSIQELSIRNDLSFENMLYADSAILFGRDQMPFYQIDGGIQLNITGPDGFEAGNVLEVRGSWFPGVMPTSKAFDVQANAEGTKWIRLIVDSDNGWDILYCHCEEDIPPYLQDVESQPITSIEKEIIQSKVFPLIHEVSVPEFANLPVSVFADGHVLSSPLNTLMGDPMIVPADGLLQLNGFYRNGYVGLPYKSIKETLPLEASDNRTFSDRGKNINRAGIAVVNTLGGFVTQKPDADIDINTVGFIAYERDSTLVAPAAPVTDLVNEIFPSEYNMAGSLSIIQVDPLPITVTAVYPKGVIGD